ncbi:MAG: hypothetical protein COA85_02430 [Robiginitomaculum sp.]|nr:MAG: hypothetical protein COA85_02430 [Robiginitomaculum sp.]
MTKAHNAPFIMHFLGALLVSYGLSVAFWLGLGVFNLMGFVFVSALAAALGVFAGWFMGKHLWVTVLATLLCRLGLYMLMMRSL